MSVVLKAMDIGAGGSGKLQSTQHGADMLQLKTELSEP